MLVVARPQTDPYFNIAAEEYLLKHLEADCFMLWQNEPSVIIGKHQNALAEINLHSIRQRNIPVVRRISGGGAVYHDLGNLNFTFIKRGEKGKLVDFSRFIQPVVKVLNNLGVPARMEGKSDIRVNGLKVSGNSEHVHRDKVLHHGTLLFNSNLQVLHDMLMVTPQSYKDKSVQSMRSKVANISSFLTVSATIDEFKNRIMDVISHTKKKVDFYKLTERDIAGINDLVNKKYKTWEWNFGYSPVYVFNNKIIHQEAEYRVEMEVKNGVINQVEIIASADTPGLNELLTNLLIGCNHDYDEIKNRIIKLNRKGESLNFDPNILLELLF
jgi:lipoate-protein ligase A